MERSDWVELEKLCRTALEDIPPVMNDHPIADAVRLTGAFAASTVEHWDAGSQNRNGTDDEAEYQRGIADTKRAQERGPAGSPEREQGYREMEAQWEREGFDG
jgi:hypothetical protein